jgi:hypothetical protein
MHFLGSNMGSKLEKHVVVAMNQIYLILGKEIPNL